VLKVPHSQDLLATILSQKARPPKQPVPDLSVFDMTEDLPTTNINVEEEVMIIEPNIVGSGVEASGKQVQVTDLGNCALQRIAAMVEHDEGEDDELSANDWEGVTVEDFDRLHRLHSTRTSTNATAQPSIQYRDWKARLRASAVALSSWRVKLKS
jgi:hypothetical protein